MHRIVRARGMALIGIAGAALLAACGGGAAITTQTPVPSPTASATPTAIPSPTTVPTIVPTTRPATTVAGSVAVPDETFGRNCGTVQMRGTETINGPSAQQSEECFWQAYQRQCAPVGTFVLRVTQMGVDTFTARDFTMHSGSGGCIIQENVEFRVIPRPPTTATYSCAGLTRDPNGALHFQACGKDGDIIVAPPNP